MSWTRTIASLLLAVGVLSLTLEDLSFYKTYFQCDDHPIQPPPPSAELSAAHRLPSAICDRLADETLYRQHEPNNPFLDRLDQEYHLTKEILRHGGVVRGKLQPEFLRKLAANEPMNILTLGGSFTRGHGCAETKHSDELECAWTARFERWWKNHFAMPGAKSHWVHAAEHGSGSIHALQRIGVMVKVDKPDFVLIDFLVNDAVLGFREATVGFESLIRKIMELAPQAQIFLIEAGCPYCLRENLLRQRRQISRHYNLPVIDYAHMVDTFNTGPDNKDVLWPFTEPRLKQGTPFLETNQTWPNFLPVTNVTKATCCASNHPPWPVHQYVSDAVAYSLVQQLKGEGCPTNQQQLQLPYNGQSDLDMFPTCTTPLTTYDALETYRGESQDASSAPTSHGWRLYEDKPGRPGWIANETNATISFPVRFGGRPMLAITYLRSYATLGQATVRMTSHTGTWQEVMLDGLWERNYSLPHTSFFIGRSDGVDGNLLATPLESDGFIPGYESWNAVAAQQEHNYTIDITFHSGSKFKILQVLSC